MVGTLEDEIFRKVNTVPTIPDFSLERGLSVCVSTVRFCEVIQPDSVRKTGENSWKDGAP
jgi:hypothetical protein